jgi:RNA polymerase sigma-70 factor (ECF subfamily)
MSGEYVPEWNIGICRPGGKGVHFGAGLKEKLAMWLATFFHGEGNESVIASDLEKANAGQMSASGQEKADVWAMSASGQEKAKVRQMSASGQEKAKVRLMSASGQEKAEVRSTPVTAKEKTGGGPSPGYIKENAARLLDVHGDSVLRMAYSYMHNMQDAEDILQETLIRYMKVAPEFDNESHARAWLLRVAANLSKNRIEYNRYRMADELNEELVAEEREDLSFVWEAVKSLPVTYRETIHLFYREGFKTAQIAEILGEKESTVRSHLKRGREKLREILKEAYDFEE